MPTYRGNRGNLLPHWVLVELIGCMRRRGIVKLCFVDAHSMSPTATRSETAATDQTAHEFDHARSRLGRSNPAFEQAWLTLSKDLRSEYPSSAAFVRHCWPERVHFVLCEADGPTADNIERWLSRLDGRITSFELYRGDWRRRLAEPFPTDWDAYYFSFDPNMHDRHNVRSPKAANMYSSNIDLLRGAISQRREAPILVQLSTYSVNGGNRQSHVFESVVPRFKEMDFSPTYVTADNSMMSFIFSRHRSLGS